MSEEREERTEFAPALPTDDDNTCIDLDEKNDHDDNKYADDLDSAVMMMKT